MVKILGITGGIGSGKSSVSRLLSCYCLAPLIDLISAVEACLILARLAGRPCMPPMERCISILMAQYRRKLREAIFNDANLRQEVDALLHPLALACMHSAIQNHTTRPEVSLVLIEIPLLLRQVGRCRWMRSWWCIPVGRSIHRLMRRDQVSRKEARQALAAQMDLAEKARRADYVIENSGWARTRGDVVALGDRLCDMP